MQCFLPERPVNTCWYTLPVVTVTVYALHQLSATLYRKLFSVVTLLQFLSLGLRHSSSPRLSFLSLLTNTLPLPAPLKLRPYGAIQICLLLLLLLLLLFTGAQNKGRLKMQVRKTHAGLRICMGGRRKYGNMKSDLEACALASGLYNKK